MTARKEYTYSYEEGKLSRSAECDITVGTDAVITAKTLVNTIFYVYNEEGTLIRKRILPAEGEERVIYYETADDNTVVKFEVPAPTETDVNKKQTVTSHSKTDSFGRKVFEELQLGTGFVSRQFSYHAGAVTGVHQENGKLKSSPTTQLVSQIVLSDGRTLTYEYDAEERITKVTDSVDGVTEYTYDAMGQLLTETVNGEVVNEMVYDNYGNILQKNGIRYTYSEVWNDRLAFYDGEQITYDAQGNPLNYLGHTLTWEKGRQLKSFDGIQFTYNANGIRTSKTVDGIRHDYLLDGVNILRETWDDNVLETLYDNEDSVCGIIYNGVPYYFHKNLQGDIIAVADQDGKVVARYTYDAWGKCQISVKSTNAAIAEINPYRYRGYYFDTETGFYYLQSRYYDPEIGRFVNADEMFDREMLLGFALFTYCGNSPVIYIDATGYGRTYVLYYDLPGSDFIQQAKNSPYYNKNSKSVHMRAVTSYRDFVEEWNKMSGTIDYVYLYLHGGSGKLYLGQDTVSLSGRNAFKSLKEKSVKRIYLFSCKGGAGKEGANVAWMFAKLTNARVIACTGSVSYSKIGSKYYARKSFKDLGIIKTFYYEKKYVFWGSVVAKSAPGQW